MSNEQTNIFFVFFILYQKCIYLPTTMPPVIAKK